MSISPVPSDGFYASDMHQPYPVYRSVYPYRPVVPTAIAPRQTAETHGTEQATQVIVPSMPILVPAPGPFLGYYPAPFYQASSDIALPQQDHLFIQPLYHPTMVPAQMPIHHTLKNATITYDTVVEESFQKDLVKDVFFSPAMITPQEGLDLESSSSAVSVCGSLQSDCESDVSSTGRALVDDDVDADAFSPHVTPSNLFNDDPLFFIGLEFEQDTWEVHESLKTTEYEHVQLGSLKRRRVRDDDDSKRSKHATPPMSPGRPPAFLDCHYFDDTSAEESSDDESQDTTTTHASAFGGQHKFDSASCDGDNNEQVDAKTPSDTGCHEEKLQQTCSMEKTPPRPTAFPTIYQKLTEANVDWCRYCGTTEGVNWRPGPWGKRTLCNKHGCDYKGYGFACKLPRLDLTGFAHETIDDRDRPVLQLFCAACQQSDSWVDNVLVRCEGCPKAMHQKCAQLTDAFVKSNEAWFCDVSCCENVRRKRIVVELPRKRLPLMRAPKASSPTVTSEGTRTRSSRDSC